MAFAISKKERSLSLARKVAIGTPAELDGIVVRWIRNYLFLGLLPTLAPRFVHYFSQGRGSITYSAQPTAIPGSFHHGPPIRNGQLLVRRRPSPQQQSPPVNNTMPLKHQTLTAALARMSPTTPSRMPCSRTPQTPTGTTSMRCQSTMSTSTTSSACGLRGTHTSATTCSPPVS